MGRKGKENGICHIEQGEKSPILFAVARALPISECGQELRILVIYFRPSNFSKVST